jgi:hypothetical protein
MGFAGRSDKRPICPLYPSYEDRHPLATGKVGRSLDIGQRNDLPTLFFSSIAFIIRLKSAIRWQILEFPGRKACFCHCPLKEEPDLFNEINPHIGQFPTKIVQIMGCFDAALRPILGVCWEAIATLLATQRRRRAGLE